MNTNIFIRHPRIAIGGVLLLLVLGVRGCSGPDPSPDWPINSCVAHYGSGENHLGPCATIRRAEEVAGELRHEGLTTNDPYHNGDGYYVNARCA
jgi:hypothetical protein